MRRKNIILRLVLFAAVAVFVSDADASGKKKHKKSAHDHLHVEDIDAAENPRAFIDNKHDVDGYLVIGWFYKSKNLKEAFSVVNEGIKHNPKAFQLHYLLSQLYLSQAKTETPNVQFPNEKATETLGKARKGYQKAAEMGLKERGDGTAEAWSQAKELDARGAARMTVLMGRRYGDHIESARLAKLYSDRLGGDDTLDRLKSTQ